MKISTMIMSGVAMLAMGGLTMAPVTANAQSWRQHRHDQQNEWRNIAIGAGALGVLGLLSHDNTLTFAGAAGSLYAVSRYNDDRASTDRGRRLRAEYFSRPYFYRDGVRYDRTTVNRHGQSYYRFVRHHG